MDRFEWLIRVFEEQIPFNRLIGLRVVEIDSGSVLLHVPYRADLVGDFMRPALHGGVVSSCADVAGGMAVWSTLSPDDRVSTIDLRVDYLQPAAAGDLWCRAEVLRVGNRVSVADVILYQDSPDTPIAAGRCAYNIKRREE